jgi:hypothetical protein
VERCASKGVVNMTGGDIDNDIPTLNEQLSIAASTAALTGGVGAFSQRGKNSKARQLAVYQSAKSYPETITMLNTMEQEGYDADRIDAIKSEVTNMFVTLKEVPADLSAPKRIAIAEKLNTIKKIEDAMASGISPFIADRMNDSIKKISDDIQNIITDPNYDEVFGKEVNEDVAKSEDVTVTGMPVVEITPTTEEMMVEEVEKPTVTEGKDVPKKEESGIAELNAAGKELFFEKPIRKEYEDGVDGDNKYAQDNITHNEKVDNLILSINQNGTLIDNSGIEYDVQITSQGVRVSPKTQNDLKVYARGKRVSGSTPFTAGFKFIPATTTTTTTETVTPVAEEAVITEPAQSEQKSGIEAQKADIEKTLYGTMSGSIPLSKALPNGVYVDLGNGLFAYADKGDKISAIVDKNNGYIVSKSFWNTNANKWQLPNQSNLKDDAKRLGIDEAIYIKKYQDAVNELNAKYDAELAALEGTKSLKEQREEILAKLKKLVTKETFENAETEEQIEYRVIFIKENVKNKDAVKLAEEWLNAKYNTTSAKKADIERRRQEALFGNITPLEFETTDTKGRTRKTIVKTKVDENGFQYSFETTIDGKSSSTAHPKVTKQEFINSSIYKNLDQNSKEFIDELPEDAVILLQSIAISTDKNSAAGLGNGNITIGYVSKELGGRVDDIALKYQPNEINAKYDAELAALNQPAQSEAVKEDTTTNTTTDEKGNEKGRQKGLLNPPANVTEDAAPIPEAPPLDIAEPSDVEVEDEPTTQVFVATDGTTVEETKLATLVVKDKKGKRVDPKKRAKILRQYRKEKLQGGKRIEEVDLNKEGIQGDEAMRYVAENSTSPAQLLELMGKQSSNQNEMTSNDFYIAENIDKVTPESWSRFGDRNVLDKDIKKNYISNNGTTVDEIAQAASYALNPEGDGTEITPDEVVEFMKSNPQGIKDAYIPTNPDAEMLRDAFIALTGMTPTKAMIARALKEESIRYDENFAGLEPNPQEIGTLREGETKGRRTYKRYEKLTDVSGKTKAQIPNEAKEYLVQTNKMSIAEARATIRDIGMEETDKLIRDLNNGMNGAVRTVAATVLLKTYEAQGLFDKHTDLTRWIILHLTDAGQTIQAASLLEAIKPDYTLAGSEFEYEKATGEKLPEHLRKRFEVLGKEITALEKKAQEIKDKLKEKALEDATVNIIDSVKREEKKPAKKKMQSLSTEKAARKKELRGKYLGIFNDFTNIPKLLLDKEFLEYNKLILEEAAGDFKNFVKILISELGSKTRPYAREFYKAAGGTELPELEKAYYDEEGKIKIPKEVIREIVMTNDIKKADELVAKVMEYVHQDFPEATDTEVKESITEYGKTVNPSKDRARC